MSTSICVMISEPPSIRPARRLWRSASESTMSSSVVSDRCKTQTSTWQWVRWQASQRTMAQTSSNRHQMRSSGIVLRQLFFTATTLPIPTIMLSNRLIHAPVEPSPSEN